MFIFEKIAENKLAFLLKYGPFINIPIELLVTVTASVDQAGELIQEDSVKVSLFRG